MKKEDIKLCKAKILKCFTEEFTYGKRKDGKPLKRPKQNVPLFIASGYFQGKSCYIETNLEMVMDKVVLGLYFAFDDLEKEK